MESEDFLKFRGLSMWSSVFSIGRELSSCLTVTSVRLDFEQSSCWISCISFIGCISLVKHSKVNLLKEGLKLWLTLSFYGYLMIKFVQCAFPYKIRWPKWQFTKFMVWNGSQSPKFTLGEALPRGPHPRYANGRTVSGKRWSLAKSVVTWGFRRVNLHTEIWGIIWRAILQRQSNPMHQQVKWYKSTMTHWLCWTTWGKPKWSDAGRVLL